MQLIKNSYIYINQLSRRSKILLGVAVIVLVFVILHLGGGAPAAETLPGPTQVTLASVASLSNAGGPLPLTGRVTSISQASISALSGGQITSLRAKLGSRVAAGSVIASFENASQQAAVLQAQGSYDAALAAQRAVSPTDTRAAAVSTFRNAFATLDTTLSSQINLFFGVRTVYGPQLLIEAPEDNRFGKLSLEYEAITKELKLYREKLVTADSADPVQLLQYASELTERVSNFLNQLSIAAGRRTAGTTDAQVAALSSARSGINTLTTTLAAAASTYRSGSVTTTSSTDASITIALGGLRAAQASLEKTYVRAPIAGTIVSLPVHMGDFVSPGTLVAIISNPGALQVETQVTAADAKTLRVGGKATIEGSTPGTIVFIAPALDPLTGKIQVKISIQGSGLTDGSSVAVNLERGTTAANKNTITIPIAAAKITPQGPVVFTVASSTLVAHPVVFGPIAGGQVTIVSGLTFDMDIVVDARGLLEGQEVKVVAN